MSSELENRIDLAFALGRPNDQKSSRKANCD